MNKIQERASGVYRDSPGTVRTEISIHCGRVSYNLKFAIKHVLAVILFQMSFTALSGPDSNWLGRNIREKKIHET